MSQSESSTESPRAAIDSNRPAWVQVLPGYARSLLRIKVPVGVTLAKTKQPVRQIVELVPGSILQFDKLCDETLTLEVDNQSIAEGEAVKVGDKFGLRITSMIMPEARFRPVVGKSS